MSMQLPRPRLNLGSVTVGFERYGFDERCKILQGHVTRVGGTRWEMLRRFVGPRAFAAHTTRRLLSSKPAIVIGADGFGEHLKNAMSAHLKAKGYEVEDVGTDTYFQVAADVAKKIQGNSSTRGMLFCGTGMGVGIMANKFSGIQAATCENVAAARLSRSINNSNVLALGGLLTPPDQAAEIVDAWLQQEHGKPPCGSGEKAPEWWSDEVEQFLATKWDAISEVEKKSRSS